MYSLKFPHKISPETESLHLTHGFVFNKLGSRWCHGGLIHIMPKIIPLTLKEPGGGIHHPLDIFYYISAGCYFFALKLYDFFSSSLALDLRPFLKNWTGGYDAALRNRPLGPTKNWPKTDFQWKLHTNRVFFCFVLFQDTLSLSFILFIWFIWSKNMCKHTLTHIIAKKCNFCLKK